jgi:molybdopterin-guanine dinucleotide biosynthesis protein A
MGRDKAFVEIDGVPMLERVVAAALGMGLPVMVVGRARPDPWPYHDVRFVPDDVPDRGPLGGLAAALAVAGGPIVALACDMPFVTSEALAWLIDVAAAAPEGDGLIVRSDGRLQPLFAVYAASALAGIEAALAGGDYAVGAAIARGTFAEADVPGLLAACVRNVNVEADIPRAADPR